MSKRGNIFEQGKPENPYSARDDTEEPSKRATAAQMAARKIKTLKGPRRAQNSSGLSQSTSFGMPQQQQPPSGFNFGATAPIGNTSANSFSFGSQQQSTPHGGAFGGNTTSSFPPAQAPTPNNAFANSSFPSFGADSANAGSGFNPQPPSSNTFNFAAGGTNPFAATTPAPATNGSGGFSGSIFSMPSTQAQPANNAFNFTSAAQNNNSVTTTTANVFGSTAGPQSNLFGAMSSGAQNGNSTVTAAPPSTFFGGIGSTSSAPTPSAPTPAPSGGLFNFGQNTTPSRESSPATQSNMFGSVNASTPAPPNNIFSAFGSTTKNAEPTTTSDNPAKFFFGSTPQASTAAMTTSDSASLKTSAAPASNPFDFGATIPKAPESQPQKSLFNFGSTTPAKPESTVPKSNPLPNFGSISQPQSSSTSLFGQSRQSSQQENVPQNNTSSAVEYPSLSAPLEAQKTPFSFTPQKPFGNATNNVPAATPSLQPPKSNPFAGIARSPSPSKESASTTPSLQPSKVSLFAGLQPSPSPSKEPVSTSLSAQTPKANPFANLEHAQASAPSPKPATSTSTMPTLTGATAPALEAPQVTETPQIPKAHVPASWPKASLGALAHPSTLKQASKSLIDLAAELSVLNQKYREKINTLPPVADWGALSSWHQKESAEITKKIVAIKKQQAAAKGITGHESALSTKRKVAEDTTQEDAGTTTPTKRVRGGDAVSTPPPQQPALFSTTPKANPPASQTSNLFGNILKNAPASTPLFAASKSSTNDTPGTSKNHSAAQPGFQVPSFGNAGAAPSSTKDTIPQSGFQVPSFGSPVNNNSKNNASGSGFQVPAFGQPSGDTKSKTIGTSQSDFNVPSFGGTNATTNFANQFAKKAKTVEQLAAERKQKAKDEDYDSDDETEEVWSARYDKEEAARKAEEEKKIKAASGFKMTSSSTPASKSAFSFSKPASGASTPGLFDSRASSPAPSTSGALSVLDASPVSQTPASNIFGHLSSNASSNNQEESSEEEDDGEQTEGQSQANQPTNSARSITPPKSKFAQDSGSESEESLEETMRRKKQETATPKPSLLSRMSWVDDAETGVSDSEKDNNQSKNGASVFGQPNGMQTPATKPFTFFDFNKAGSQTAPAKDHTFKEGSPIKFSGAPASETKGVPLFNFQPATPSPAEFSSTPTKSAPFSFLSASNLAAGPGSGSGLSSRAGTPSSEVDASVKDSATEDDEDGSKSGQLDLSDLTDAERDEYEIVFHTELAIAKRSAQKDGTKGWENFARGPLWMLKNKESGKSIIRMRIPSGKTPVNYSLLPKLQAKVSGNSKKMVMASYPVEDGKLSNIIFAVTSQEVADEFADAYNSHLPS